MDNNKLPVIDWDLATKLAGNNRKAANELISFFMQHLDRDIDTIHQYYTDKNFTSLCHAIHKFHGAVCYCGLPRLKNLLNQLESNLKNDILDDLPSQMDQLETEISTLIELYSRQNS